MQVDRRQARGEHHKGGQTGDDRVLLLAQLPGDPTRDLPRDGLQRDARTEVGVAHQRPLETREPQPSPW
eukprot:8662625-Pyramimonas_sp.AAC.1